MQNIDNSVVINAACIRKPKVFEKYFENGKVALKCKVCNSIVRNIENLSDALAHTKQPAHKEAESKVSKIPI